MSHYDQRLSFAKQAVTEEFAQPPDKKDWMRMAGRIDELNKAWDELTDALVRQRQEYIDLVNDLVRQLAEAKKHRP